MQDIALNADFGQRVVIATDSLAWAPSPVPSVLRRPLDRIGGEVARATSIVRFAPGSRFPVHEHGLGEEFFVLEGVFSDEEDHYPAGTYVRNPPGSRHAPYSSQGCTIFVKLRQMPRSERTRLVVDTSTAPWESESGLQRMRLFHSVHGEDVCLERLCAGASVASSAAGGEEILLLDGDLWDEDGAHGIGSWIRNPPGYSQLRHSRTGAQYWVKRGHLAKGPARNESRDQSVRHG